jgi:hypothetical protein
MRSLLAAVAAFLLVTAVASLDATAQQAFRPPAPAMAEPLVAKVAMKKRRTARTGHRKKRHAALQTRAHNPCKIIDGWRAFPTRDPHGYFDTRPVCSRY